MCFENWLIPQVDKEYGREGVDTLEALWTASDVDLFNGLSTAVISRTDATSYNMMSLSFIGPVADALERKFRPASGGLTRTVEKSLLEQWKQFQVDIQRDEEYFKRCVQAKAKLDKLCWLDKMRQVSGATVVGQDATDAFLEKKTST